MLKIFNKKSLKNNNEVLAYSLNDYETSSPDITAYQENEAYSIVQGGDAIFIGNAYGQIKKCNAQLANCDTFTDLGVIDGSLNSAYVIVYTKNTNRIYTGLKMVI